MPWFEIDLETAATGSRDASRRLHALLKAAIQEGRLAAGSRLPSARQARAVFGVSRNTAAAVYDRLGGEGLVVARQGSGVYVADVPAIAHPSETRHTEFAINPVWQQPALRNAIHFWADAAKQSPPSRRSAGSDRTLDFRPGLVDLRVFPHDVFRRVTSSALRRIERTVQPGPQRSPQGHQGSSRLRHAITGHVSTTRAVACDPGDVLVTAGAQQAFDLLARVLVTPGETVVAIENPCYPPMYAALVAAGARVVPVRVDQDGLVVDELPPDARVICVCPSHQFPTGVALSAERRRQLVAVAVARGAVIIEDDYDGEFRFEGSALQALWTEAARDVVFYVGTFSKCMFPALRLGFIVAPPWAMPSLVIAKNCMDWHCPTHVQLSVATFIADGHLARHTRRMRDIYLARRDTLLAGIERELSSWLAPLPSFYGMHVAAVARQDLDIERAAMVLSDNNVHVHTLSRYHVGPSTWTGLVLNYATLDAAEIRQGLEKIHRALDRDIESGRS